ncbi:MAG: hypothetical protein MZV63_45510 [Marinilabiliales bacterium]|nr:hypothetical protein [Marinilabiliales bacterium]
MWLSCSLPRRREVCHSAAAGASATSRSRLAKRALIAADAARSLTQSSPDELITACPLCKKTFGQATETKVSDIAELVAAALPKPVKRVQDKENESSRQGSLNNG